ncbi:TetR family transcriptional regulator [Luteococcus japonicus]|uniref:TetR family transcriptional regulator n=1 Tax=Luteococcus japonicus TaxID=33984 RepID=A0A3N1ZWH8_9ACTN|nr:TetR family transcriptional regulator [Luteococcus japonicus]ROR55210.1 TetR family transcriptional regulator [Luteococcus japonicus]
MTRMALAERRQKLIEAALAVIGQQGVSAATTRAIASEAEMPLASFHYAFESHQALMSEAMEVLDRLEREHCEGLVISGATLPEMVTGMLENHLDDLVERRSAYLSRWELADHALRTDAMQERPAQWRQRRRELVAGKVAAHLASHPELGGHDARAVTEAMLVMCDGIEARYLVTADEAGTRQAIAALASTFTR